VRADDTARRTGAAQAAIPDIEVRRSLAENAALITVVASLTEYEAPTPHPVHGDKPQVTDARRLSPPPSLFSLAATEEGETGRHPGCSIHRDCVGYIYSDGGGARGVAILIIQ
jgi:hypothetical protein